jgi:hypothetical protein
MVPMLKLHPSSVEVLVSVVNSASVDADFPYSFCYTCVQTYGSMM